MTGDNNSTTSNGTSRRNPMSWVLENATLTVSLFYGYITVMGIFSAFYLYREFGINIFDYFEISDFLFAALKNPPALYSVVVPVAAIAFAAWFLNQPMSQEKQARLIFLTIQTVFILVAISVVPVLSFTAARSIKEGEQPSVVVRYSSSAGSADQVTKPGLELIGASQQAMFFYDVNDQHTLVIPKAGLVSIEVPDTR